MLTKVSAIYFYGIYMYVLFMKQLLPFYVPHTLTAALVVELLEYCDEFEDSQEEGGSDNEMEEGEKDERKERAKGLVGN